MQRELNIVGTCVEVGQKNIGFGAVVAENLIYVRQETVDMWNAIESEIVKGFNISVGGPPGTGKSTEAWAWARWKASSAKKKVVWFHFTKRGVLKVDIDGSTGMMTCLSAEITDIKSSDGDYLVADGLTKHDSTAIFRACSYWQGQQEGRVYVTVSSVSLSAAVEQNEEFKISEYTVASWTFEDYEKACENNVFFEKVRGNLCCVKGTENKAELLLSKYEFAGGCARWMFEFTHEKWKTDFDEHLQKVTDYKHIFSEAGGDANPEAVNHLRGLTMNGKEKKYFFVSQHAIRALSEKTNDKRAFIVESYKKAHETKNPSYLGWIFEFDVDFQLNNAHTNKGNFTVSLRGENEEKEELPVTSYITYSDEKEIARAIGKLNGNEVLWAKPSLWCQKAFDFLHFRKTGNEISMAVVNATHAKKHAVLLETVSTLGKNLGRKDCVIAKIRFDFFVPSTADFKVGEVTGRLCEWKNMDGIPWPNKLNANEYVEGRFIVIADVACTKQ